MTDAGNNNSGNNCAGGGGQWITVTPSKQYTVTIPNGSSSGGQTITIPTTNAMIPGIVWVTPGQTYTGGGGAGAGQITFDDIDLAVPVEEKKEISDGCTCKKCKEFYPYAEPNQNDNTLICYGCRMVW